ncbi:MAG: dTDP-4-dehydrorhamnose 3,5-epimerase family protein [Rhodospirillales bacterium]|nr:dTDP-4-dehydrorhamnose 3,5-epimerase family protein [Alphaproteobacteria bacterium]USO06215.1 MAG: dTDP-4-dehydrorhamnose 3,5-epimerase family protein [Rhodospirillales bacterium]HOO49719.1 dTDP-4-dehydrorhamnose 3,5-epimerase family protein [Alphaproteobacteria bacterium]
MDIQTTDIEGVYYFKKNLVGDQRGHFTRLFCENELGDVLQGRQIKQINHSYTKDVGSVRGIHFQKPPHAEMKFISCLKGRVLDIAVDIRAGSATFLNYCALELSAENQKTIIIPEGFAHGFQVLEEGSELLYFHTEFYNPDFEGGLRYDDPALSIDWPLVARNISERDQRHPLINNNFNGLGV